MASAGRVISFVNKGNNWYCNAGLPSDINITLDGLNFHLHQFPLASRCGVIDKACRGSLKQSITLEFEEFPGGHETFLAVVKFCYGLQMELTPRNVVKAICAAQYLEMTRDYGEDNLLVKCEMFLHEKILVDWKHCIVALQNSDPVLDIAEQNHVLSKCLDAISMMASTDRGLFGWPMMMYGSLQSPGGSILWNGINTGTMLSNALSDWWFEDVSCLSVRLFEMLVRNMEKRGIRTENIIGVIIYYVRKYLPGLDRWMGGPSRKTRRAVSIRQKPCSMNEKMLLEIVASLLPSKKGKHICRFLLALLRVALILGAGQSCIDTLEERIGMQLDVATLDSLLIPSYSDADTLYAVDSVERMVCHFFSSISSRSTMRPPSLLSLEASPSPEPMKKVAKLVDNYIAEVASDVNLKPSKIRSLVESLPDSSRELHDGTYRAIDIYLKEHPWLSEKEKEDLCNLIDFQKLSMAACNHASQNERLPLRIIFQVLFFEQLQLRSALSSWLRTIDNASVHPTTVQPVLADQIAQIDDCASMMHDNRVLKVDLENMISRVADIEADFNSIKEEMRKVRVSSSHASSHMLLSRFGCKFLHCGTTNRTEPTPCILSGQAQSSRLSNYLKLF